MPAPAESPKGPTFEAIDFAVSELGITSFADLDMGPVYGRHSLYAIARPTVRAGALVDARQARRGEQLLDAIDHASERPGMRVVDGDAFDPATIEEVGAVGAVFVFNVLLHAVAPDWDRVLALYAERTSCFVVANPQWRTGTETVRLVELGRERYLEAVPAGGANRELFDHLDDWLPADQRQHRDTRTAWQWGLTDADLKRTLSDLGYELVRERSHGFFPGAEAFENKTFVFSRR